MSEIKHILCREDLWKLAQELGLRSDWHEPGEQEVEAICFGEDFDNAGFWGRRFRKDQIDRHFRISEEMNVMLVHRGKPVAEINLATLFAIACGTWEGK